MNSRLFPVSIEDGAQFRASNDSFDLEGHEAEMRVLDSHFGAVLEQARAAREVAQTARHAVEHPPLARETPPTESIDQDPSAIRRGA